MDQESLEIVQIVLGTLVLVSMPLMLRVSLMARNAPYFIFCLIGACYPVGKLIQMWPEFWPRILRFYMADTGFIPLVAIFWNKPKTRFALVNMVKLRTGALVGFAIAIIHESLQIVSNGGLETEGEKKTYVLRGSGDWNDFILFVIMMCVSEFILYHVERVELAKFSAQTLQKPKNVRRTKLRVRPRR